jgi:CRISPR-associated protein Cas2
MNKEKDSLRFYYLGKNCETKIEHLGAKMSYEPEGMLMV